MRVIGLFIIFVGIAFFGPFSAHSACAQGADDPARLRAEIEHSEDDAASALLQDGDDLWSNTKNAFKNELKKDVTELEAKRAAPTAVVVVATAVPTLDDSNASIEEDIDSLESQEEALGTAK